MDTSLIERYYLDSKITDMNGYPYSVNPVTDGTPDFTKELMDQITDGLIEIADLDCDLILAPEAMGIQYATALTLRTGIPFQVIRKRKYGLPGEITFSKSTGYAKSEMHVNNVAPGTKVVIVDDIISTGGSLLAIVNNLREHGIIITEVLMVLNKGRDLKEVSEEIGVTVKSLVSVGMKDGRPVIL